MKFEMPLSLWQIVEATFGAIMGTIIIFGLFAPCFLCNSKSKDFSKFSKKMSMIHRDHNRELRNR